MYTYCVQSDRNICGEMAWYEASTQFQMTTFKWQKLDCLLGTMTNSVQSYINYLDGWEGLRTRLEYCTPLKKGFVLQSKGKGAHFEILHRHERNFFPFFLLCFVRHNMASTLQICFLCLWYSSTSRWGSSQDWSFQILQDLVSKLCSFPSPLGSVDWSLAKVCGSGYRGCVLPLLPPLHSPPSPFPPPFPTFFGRTVSLTCLVLLLVLLLVECTFPASSTAPCTVTWIDSHWVKFWCWQLVCF